MEAFIHNYLASFPTIGLFIIIAVSIFTLSKGADTLVDEAVSLSVRIGVPKLIIGATIISLGTTLPEASVSVMAAINGNPDLALGNAIGSIIANTGLILGIAALIGTLPVSPIVVKRHGKIKIGSGILLAGVTLPLFSSNTGIIQQWMGWGFMLLLIGYIYRSIKWTTQSSLDETAATSSSKDISAQTNITAEVSAEEHSLIIQILKLLFGIAVVIISSKILIPAVELSAVRIGIPQSIIAATLVAFGTSLPELTTAVTAVKKGHGELAVGNIVGADILNILFVIGASASVTPEGLEVPVNFYKLQIPTMLILLITFRFFSKKHNNNITKKEGITLLGIYIIYIILNFTWV